MSHTHHSVTLKALQHLAFSCKVLWSLKYETDSVAIALWKVLWCNLHPIKPGIPGRTPSLFRKCITHKSNPKAQSEGRSIMVNCLIKETSVMTGTSNPHSADQKHQSPMFWSAQQQHTTLLLTSTAAVTLPGMGHAWVCMSTYHAAVLAAVAFYVTHRAVVAA